MKKIIGIIILVSVIVIGINLYHCLQDIRINEDQTVAIPKRIQNKIDQELFSYTDLFQETLDGKDAIVKEDVKILLEGFSADVCVIDAKGYFDLQNQDVFIEFWNQYKQARDTHLTHYTILSTGNLRRQDIIVKKDKAYLITTTLNVKEGTLQHLESYQIEDLSYDQGYFSYHILIPESLKNLGGYEYGCFRVDPLGEELREWNVGYIQSIGYDCQNLFLQTWDQENMTDIAFTDLIAYLYQMDKQSPIPQNVLTPTGVRFLSFMDADFYESVIQNYFNVDVTRLREHQFYDASSHTYPYYEGGCEASHFDSSTLFSEVVNAYYEESIVYLDVQALNYKQGQGVVFTHRVVLEDVGDHYRYMGNQILEVYGTLPSYQPKLNADILNGIK